MDLNDFAFFAAVVQHGGFTAAARATGIDKARLSRHVAALEERLGARLLQRTTRNVSLTQAGRSVYESTQAMLESAQSAFDGVLELRREPSGRVRIGCSVILAQHYLAPLLPAYMAAHPKVTIILEATDRPLHPLEEALDLILCRDDEIPDSTSLVARELGRVRRGAVASPAFVERHGMPGEPGDLAQLPTIARPGDMHEDHARWDLVHAGQETQRVLVTPRLVTGDLPVQLEAARSGLGVALLAAPLIRDSLERGEVIPLLPGWYTSDYRLCLVYPTPRGMLPSVRSLVDHLLANGAASLIGGAV
ncbi:MAG: LysR family transcriptional regulator [Sphingomonadales bacterium]|nr:LysR family transcriptional regulator [Sphingomonadales bacterium]MDE2169320.1 LysR family transcriptional regulator [Sphingomonadales bacterium]